MKYTGILAAASIVLGLTAGAVWAQEDNTDFTDTGAVHRLMVNGKPTGGEVAPRTLGNTVYVPLRFVTDYLGGGAEWNGQTQTARLRQGTKNIILKIGSKNAMINGEGRALTQAPRLYQGRTMLPLRAVAQLLGAEVSYNPSSGVVFVNVTGGSIEPPIRSGRAARVSSRVDGAGASTGTNQL